MKFNLKESLIKYNLLKEGWMQDLENQYDEDLLIFVGRMLQKVYGDENIENHKLAPWIAEVTKKIGKAPYDLDSKDMKSAVHAFEMILNYIKSENDSEESISNITSKDPRAAYAYAKEGLEGSEYPEQIQKMLDDGTIRIVQKLGDGRMWVEVLNKSFFTTKNKEEAEYGVACQYQGSQPGAKYVGSPYKTYTLLALDKSGDFYNTLVSIALNESSKGFIEIKDKGNVYPGKQANKGWSKESIVKATYDFIVSELSDYDKYYDWGTERIPERCPGKWGAAGSWCEWVKNYPNIIRDIISKTPSTLDNMENLIRNADPNFLEALELDYDELLQNNPDRFFDKFNVYLSAIKSKHDLEDLLKDFNFKDYSSSESGQRALFKALPLLIKDLSFDFFENKIYPNINFGKYLSQINEEDKKYTLRSIRNKFEKNTKSFLSSFEKMFEDFVEGFGGGLKGFGKLSTFLNVPRLDMHQNFRKVDGQIVASTERPVLDNEGNVMPNETTIVDIKVPEDEKILGAKNIRDFYKKNENWIKSQMSGTDEEKKIKYLRYMLSNSSKQAKQSSLKKEKDDFISYYDSKFKKGETKLPGVLAYNVLINPKIYELTNKKNFKEGVKSYEFDKKQLKSNGFKDMVELLKYYINQSKSKYLGGKIGDAISALFDIMLNSSFSVEEISEIIFDKFNLLKIDKNLSYNSIYSWANNLIPFIQEGYVSSKELLEILQSKKIQDIVNKESKLSPTITYAYKDLLDKIRSSNSVDESIRKYISNLLSSNFKK